MQKKFTTVENIEIAYLEQNSNSAKTIFFIHGNSGSSHTWRKQITDSVFHDFRLVTFDLPAHGNSGPAPERDFIYSLPALGRIMAAALHQLSNGDSYMIAGVSLGTNIVAEMLGFDIHPKGLVLAGPTISGGKIAIMDIGKPGTHVSVVFSDDPAMDDVKSYAVETSLSDREEDFQIFVDDYWNVQKPFRSSLGKSIFENNFNDQVLLLQQNNIPLLIVFGADEKVIHASYLDATALPLWRKEIFKIPGASHLVPVDQPKAFNTLLKAFADDCFK